MLSLRICLYVEVYYELYYVLAPQKLKEYEDCYRALGN